jgi:CRISPR/Cas system CMR-associated protein Cmr1 (group 7 of RAMP superfamily)
MLGKDTSQMTLNDIFQDLVHVIETKTKAINSYNGKNFLHIKNNALFWKVKTVFRSAIFY